MLSRSYSWKFHWHKTFGRSMPLPLYETKPVTHTHTHTHTHKTTWQCIPGDSTAPHLGRWEMGLVQVLCWQQRSYWSFQWWGQRSGSHSDQRLPEVNSVCKGKYLHSTDSRLPERRTESAVLLVARVYCMCTFKPVPSNLKTYIS